MLSFKAQRVNGERAQQAFHRLRIGHDGDEDPKTERVLELFAEQLRPG